MLQKPNALGRLMKLAVELSEFDISYRPRSSMIRQALAEFTDAKEVNVEWSFSSHLPRACLLIALPGKQFWGKSNSGEPRGPQA